MKFTTTLIILALSFVCFSAHANEKKYPIEIAKFLAPNEKVLRFAKADLNLDGLMDYIVILERTNIDPNTYPDNQRPLLILIRNPNGSLYIAKRNDYAVYCSTCGGAGISDPLDDLEAKRGEFTLKFYGGDAGRWVEEYSFRYSRRYNSWQLVNLHKASFRSDDPENIKEHNYKPPRDYGLIDIEKFDLNMKLK